MSNTILTGKVIKVPTDETLARRWHQYEKQASVERLFTENFKPKWMLDIEKSVNDAAFVASEFNYRVSASENERRILSKCKGVIYHN